MASGNGGPHIEELKRKMNFFGFDPSYHIARYNFIRRVPKSRTPSWLATHRWASRSAVPDGCSTNQIPEI